MNMKKVKLFFRVFLSIPKTIYFNFRCFSPYIAIKLPVFIHWKTKIIELHKGIISLPENVTPFMVRLGWGGTISTISNPYNVIALESGKVIFKGNAMLAEGFTFRNHGTVVFGNHFYANKNLRLSCGDCITFGDNVLMGWNVVVRDSDGHKFFVDGIEKSNKRPVSIGNHVWVGAESHLIKGTDIPDGCVVAYRSLVNKKWDNEHVLLAGFPASEIHNNVDWDY